MRTHTVLLSRFGIRRGLHRTVDGPPADDHLHHARTELFHIASANQGLSVWSFAEEDNSIGYSFLGKTFPAADGTKEIYVAAIYRRYPDKRPKTRQYLRERADAHVKEFLETYPTAHIAEDTSSELNYWPTRRIRITNRKEAGIGACRDILFIANHNGLWYIDMLYISRTKEQKARMDTILSSVQFDWTDAKPTVRFDGVQPTQTFTL